MKDQYKTTLTTKELSEQLPAKLFGSGSIKIMAVNSVNQAGTDEITFLSSDKHDKDIAKSRAVAVIVTKKLDNIEMVQLVVEDIGAALIKTLNLFAPKLTPIEGVHPSAIIEKSAQIGKNVAIGAGVYISHDVAIGDNSVILAGCKIGENSRLGKNCQLDNNVAVYHNCTIGNNCTILANATIGSMGFGYEFIDGRHVHVPHNGGVVIEDCVDIGANSCVDRAKFGNTVIGAGTKIDNLCQIAHNVVIGKCCMIAGQVGFSGSVQVGDGVMLGGQAGVADHVTISDGVMVAAQSGIISDISAGEKLFGSPAFDIKEQMRIISVSRHLPKMSKEFKKLVKRVEKLEASENNQ
jgi:UDP-3-O-[3-hydroxymyristoyl] glucosamine N-acyltransferase